MPLGLDDHALDQLAVLHLDVDAARELRPGGLEPGRERIADPLEVADAEHARTARGGDAELDAGARERGGEQLAELALQIADLAPQVLAGEPLGVLEDPRSAAAGR
jgi:hypothetical protein